MHRKKYKFSIYTFFYSKERLRKTFQSINLTLIDLFQENEDKAISEPWQMLTSNLENIKGKDDSFVALFHFVPRCVYLD